ncbi:hypothetical protein BJF78_20965 [Pseudonocardia sp. CNS-139]|nr:hypothetical protein BJF78_20965 [Pseudonocardia sp. CNS-139]
MSEDTLTVLRDIWSASGQTSAQLEEQLGGRGGKVCKNMARIGFGGMAHDHGGGDTNTPVDEDVRAAWRARLARDGKLDPHARSIGETLRTQTRD